MATGSLRALKASEFDYWKARHLLSRAGFGGTPSQVRGLANLGLAGAVDAIVEYADQPGEAVRADAFDADIMRPRSDEEREEVRQARRSGDEALLEMFRQERQRRQQADRRQLGEMQEWWLRRLIETPRPLEEKMTLFWHGHFATGYRTIEDSYHMFVQNQLFRSHAAGNFKKLAHAMIRDPAMLRYLNNNQNRAEAPNENLARELMELFTLGEGIDYTEEDIKEGARALTGYAYDDDSFVFRPRLHDNGMKRILGKAGDWDGDDFVDIIFTRPAAAEFICWKLYRFFVNDLPTGPDEAATEFVRKLARELRKSDWALGPLLKTLFRSEHFYDPLNVAAQIKSPVQLIVQAVRSLRTPVRQLRTLLSAAELMGQNLFQPPSVKGWDGGRAWINTSTLFVRQNILVYLLTGQRPEMYPWDRDGAVFDARHLVEHLAGEDIGTGSDDVLLYLLRFNLGSEPHPERVRALRAVLERGGAGDAGGTGGTGGTRTLDNSMLIALLCLITAMPEYQLC